MWRVKELTALGEYDMYHAVTGEREVTLKNEKSDLNPSN